VIGGGPGSFIGSIHRGGATLDGLFDVVAGAFSSNAERSLAAAETLHVPRGYASGSSLIAEEAKLAERCDVIAIMTPNDSHFALAKQALEAGFHVFCEKPLTHTAAESDELARLARQHNRLFCVAYAYTGFPMVRQARAMIANGDLGEVRQVQVEYVQGHLAALTPEETEGNHWHFQPKVSGPSLILGEIGTHAYHLASFVTGMEPSHLTADVSTQVPGRDADDTAFLLTRYANQARGSIWVTQAAAGAEHGLMIKVFGSQGGLEWYQQQPNELVYRPLGSPCQTLVKDGPGLYPAAHRMTRVAIGHPEGYQEAFTALYLDLAEAIVSLETGQALSPDNAFPTAEDGARGIHFIEACLRSNAQGGVWEPIG
ncbi:MAG: Gfo/Idh/MocA family oxidoreductase, partial [Natronospirillum sp.]